MRRRFFVDGFESGTATLRGDAAHHLGRVLRAEAGQQYELSDGETVWLARTENIARDAVRFALLERLSTRHSLVGVTLLLAIVKFDRFEWALEKATELGADEIVPLAAERSEKGLIAASAKRASRWEKIFLESAQQSRRLRVPTLCPTATPQEAFKRMNGQLGLLLSERPDAKPLREIVEPVVTAYKNRKDLSITIAIGPEGGWTEKEFFAARASGFAEATLGVNILRTETAVCAALAATQYAFGDLARLNNREDAQAEINEKRHE